MGDNKIIMMICFHPGMDTGFMYTTGMAAHDTPELVTVNVLRTQVHLYATLYGVLMRRVSEGHPVLCGQTVQQENVRFLISAHEPEYHAFLMKNYLLESDNPRGCMGINAIAYRTTPLGEQPEQWVNVNTWNLQVCFGCCRAYDKIQRCSKCKLVRYCSRACQKNMARIHRENCEEGAARIARGLSTKCCFKVIDGHIFNEEDVCIHTPDDGPEHVVMCPVPLRAADAMRAYEAHFHS